MLKQKTLFLFLGLCFVISIFFFLVPQIANIGFTPLVQQTPKLSNSPQNTQQLPSINPQNYQQVLSIIELNRLKLANLYHNAHSHSEKIEILKQAQNLMMQSMY